MTRFLRVEDVLEDDAHICPGGRLPKTEIRERRPGKQQQQQQQLRNFEILKRKPQIFYGDLR